MISWQQHLQPNSRRHELPPCQRRRWRRPAFAITSASSISQSWSTGKHDRSQAVRVWETPTRRASRKQRHHHHPKLSSIIDAIRRNEDLPSAMDPWKGKLQPREEAIILGQQEDCKTAMELFLWFRTQPEHIPNVYRYNILFKLIGRHRRWDLLKQVWSRMQCDRVSPTNVTYSTIIDAYSKAGMREEAVAWFDDMSKENVQPDEVTLCTVVNVHKRMGDYVQAEAFSKAFLFASSDSPTSTGPVDSPVSLRPQAVETYNTMIDLYGKSGRLSDASRVFDEMLSNGLQPDTVTFNTMIHTCGVHGRLEEAEALFKKMEEDEHVPDLGTYNTMIALYCKVENAQAAQEVVTKMKNSQVFPDAVTYRTLLIAYCTRGLLTDAEAVVCEMKQAGILMNETALVHMIIMYIVAGRADTAEKHLTELNLCQKLTCTHFVGVLDAYGQRGLWKEAEHVFGFALERGLRRETVLYNVMIKAYGVAKLHQKAHHLFESMKREGVVADGATYNSIIHVACMSGQPERASLLLMEMQRMGLTPKCSSFTAILSSYGKIGEVEEAKRTFQALKGTHIQVDEVAYGALLDTFAEAGMLKEAEDVLQSMQSAGYPVNHILYTSMLQLYAKHNLIEDVERTYKEIQKLKCGPDLFARNTLLSIYSKFGMFGAARSFFNKMYEDRQIDAVTCNIMIKLFEEAGRTPEALAVAQIMQEWGLLSDISSFNSVIGLYVNAERKQAASDMFKKMVMARVWPDLTTYNRLKNILVNPGLLKEAVDQLGLAKREAGFECMHSLIALTNLYSLADMSTQAMEACSKLKNCGSIADVAAYNAMIYAFGHNGQFDEAVKMFMEMQSKDLKPTIVTYTSMLLFYGKAGLVEGVTRLFKRMKQIESVPDNAAYKVVIDIYKEAGRLDLAAMVTQEMQFARFLREREQAPISDDASEISD